MARPKKPKKAKRKRFGRDVLDWQERHNPTVEIAIDDPDATRKVRRNLTRCRQSEAWRHNQLNGMQRDAEREMELAYRLRTVGLGATSSRVGGIGGITSHQFELGAKIDATWRAWARRTRQRRIRLNVVIDCLSEPMTLPQIEARYRIRRGSALVHYGRGLDLWCELRGWISASPALALKKTRA